jgi:hypothetical protein
MENLLKETLGRDSIEEFAQKIRWAKIGYCSSDVQCGRSDDESENREFVLRPEHTLDEAIEFLKSLDFNYSNGFGLQEVFGTIVFNDNTWLDRWEYDGSEGWEYNSCPTWND